MCTIFAAKRFMLVSVFVAVSASLGLGASAANHHYHVLYNFCSQPQCTDGAQPGGVIADSSGHLFGVTYPGGDNNLGTVFGLTRGANGVYTESVLYSFCSAANCSDGALPMGSLIRDETGSLYGVTDEGGANGAGAVFELLHRRGLWKLKNLYSFCSLGNCADGKFPYAGLTYAGAQTGAPYDGSSPLFGTTSNGGTGSGVAYELRRNGEGWIEQVLYSFCAKASCRDGAVPAAPLIVDNSGNLYGTTEEGGSNGQTAAAGTVFELAPNGGGWSESVLHSFCAKKNCRDGELPFGGLAEDSADVLYGFASEGGIVCADTDHGPCGVIYSVATTGTGSQYTVVYTFGQGGRADDGANPSGTPVLDASGNLFGTTSFGGTGLNGVAFELTGSKLRVLHAFCSQSGDGCEPNSVTQDVRGRLFGTTTSGGSGTDSNGTVFELRP